MNPDQPPPPPALMPETPKLYRKTALIRAVQWLGPETPHEAVREFTDVEHPLGERGRFYVLTLEGTMRVSPGDWIATGVKGEHWPIKPDVFAASYEEARSAPLDAGRALCAHVFEADYAMNDSLLRYCTKCGIWEGAAPKPSPSPDAALREAVLDRFAPRRFRWSLPEGEKHPNGTETRWRYGCYFPQTDLVIGDMGARGTGAPPNVEWIDPIPEHIKKDNA